MRIGIFTNTYYPSVNGVAQCVSYYEQGLRERGHEVVVFAPAPEDYDRSQDGENVYRFPTLPLPIDVDYSVAAPYSAPVVKALRRLDFDIIHTQHPLWVGAWGAWYARWAEVPLVTTVHTEYRLFAHIIPLPEALVEAYLRVRVASFCNKCEVITTPAASMRRLLRKEGVRRPIEVVPNPTRIADFAHADGTGIRRQYGLAEDATVLGFVGRLSGEKNISFLMEAASQVMKHRPEVYFLLVGDGPEREALGEQARQMGLADRVLFAGVIPHSEVPQYQAALDLFITASLSETQPLAYTEAMAAGKPVIAVRAPGAQDMIIPGENGLLAEPEAGPAALAEQIESLVADPKLRAAVGEKARAWAAQTDVAQVAEKLEQVYLRARHLSEEEPI
ncbi:MAG TPA: glycosyltransferase [Armatimonadota bacterium]|jgi:glycosyltransferase involved in cell wall biosynthesis